MKRERTSSRGRGLWIAVTAAALMTGFGTASAQDKAPAGATMAPAQTSSDSKDIRLYGFSSGALTLGKGALVNFAPMEPAITVPVGFYVIKHPKGNILFDTGNNDKLIQWNTVITADRNSALDGLGLPTGYIEGTNFGKGTSNNHYPSARRFEVAVGFRF